MKQVTTDNWGQVKKSSEAKLPKLIVDYIRQIIMLPHSESYLMSVLHKLQDTMGFLGSEQLDAVAQLMQIPAAKVAGVASFYHYFRLKPSGRFVINICMGTACYVKGKTTILDALTKTLGIEVGQTTPDQLFTIQKVRCLGVCSLAPVIMIDNQVFGPLTSEDIPILLEQFKQIAQSNK